MELLLWFLSDLSPLAFQHSKGVGDVLTVFTATCSPHSVALKILPMFPPPRDRKSLSSSAHTERLRKECRCVANANISGEAARRLTSGALVAASGNARIVGRRPLPFCDGHLFDALLNAVRRVGL